MGCTGEKTYEESVKAEIRRYLEGFNLMNSRKKDINDYINQDLKKKSIALQNYQYIYREEDVKQTVEDYKTLIWEKFNIGNRPYNEINIVENNDDNKKKPKKDKKEKEKSKDGKDSDIEDEIDNKKLNNKNENNILNNKDNGAINNNA